MNQELKVLEARLDQFLKEMKQAFIDAEQKHQGHSVTDDNVAWAFFDWQSIRNHTIEEFAECILDPKNPKEWADLANMAFLNWWKAKLADYLSVTGLDKYPEVK